MTTESGFQIAHTAPHFYDLHVSEFMAPFVEALIAATIAPGDSVLDVACGTGFATRAARTATGDGPRVEGVDINAAMLAHARSVPTPASGELSWSEASALDLPHGDGEFDAVICQQGLQFFPDSAAGLCEMARVVKPGGRLGVTVWSDPDPAPFLDLETRMLARHAGGTQAAFSTTEEQLRAWFTSAGFGRNGFDEVRIERVTVDVDLPPVQEFVPQHLKALPWSAAFFDLPATRQAAAISELEAGLAEYQTDAGLTVPFSSFLATATIADRKL